STKAPWARWVPCFRRALGGTENPVWTRRKHASPGWTACFRGASGAFLSQPARRESMAPAAPAALAAPAAKTLRTALLIAALASSTAPASTADLKDSLDCGANPKLLDTHFARYGYLPLKSIVRDKQGLRFTLRPPSGNAIEQTGLYAYFAVAGDFEVSATYEVISIPAPSTGYGAQCGIAVDCERTGDTLSLSWAQKPGKGMMYIVTRGWKTE